MARYFAAADALLVHLRATPVAPLTIPSKTVAYLAARKPIVMAGVGASAEIVTRAGAGLVVPPDDPASLAKALLEVAGWPSETRARMGERGRTFFEANFTRAAALPTYLAALERSAAATEPRPDA
jgi:glycosyltransferase involved in cell wall biosynthesis